MRRENSDNNEAKLAEFQSGWKFWLDALREVLPGFRSDSKGNSAFASEIAQRFSHSHPLEDELIGQWYATLEAIAPVRGSGGSQVEARFLISPREHSSPQDVSSEAVQCAFDVSEDSVDQPENMSEFFLLFSFNDAFTVDQNVILFDESAVARVRNFQNNAPKSALELEMETSAAQRGS